MTAYPFWSWITHRELRFAHTSTSQVFSFQMVSFPLRRLGRLWGAFQFVWSGFQAEVGSPMLLVVKQRQKRMRTLIKKQALDTRTCSPGAGDRGRTGTVSLPSDFESDTSANSITPAHNIMIIAYFFHFVKQTASKFCIYSFVYFQHKTYLTTLDFWRILWYN